MNPPFQSHIFESYGPTDNDLKWGKIPCATHETDLSQQDHVAITNVIDLSKPCHLLHMGWI